METRGAPGAAGKLTLGAINLVLSTHSLFTPKTQNKTMKIHSSFNHDKIIDLYLLEGVASMVE